MNKSEVYSYRTANGKTRYVVATYADGQYTAAMDPESRRLTGCYAVFGRSVEALVVNTTTYASASGARRAMRRAEGRD